MSKTERLFRIEMLIRQRDGVNMKAMQEELEVSRATLKRDLEYLRDRLGSPIEYDRYSGMYRFAQGRHSQRHELPGLWFDERELYGLLMSHQLLSGIDSQGVISRHLQPLLDRIHSLLGATPDDARSLLARVKIITPAHRPASSQWFERVAEALMLRKRLHLRYLTRSRGQAGERSVSPQRMVNYRATWYLDAWCHRASDLRRFALDAIEEAQLLDEAAKEVPMKTVQEAMDAGYGIYAGATERWATLVFQPEAARWISGEQWHAQQQGRWLEDGCFELKLPYTDETELVMDILRHGPQVRVVAPESLAASVRQRLEAAARAYR